MNNALSAQVLFIPLEGVVNRGVVSEVNCNTLAFLVKLMEQHCCQYGWTHGFVSRMFIEMGVSYSSLFNIYNRLFNEKVVTLV